MLKHRWFKLRGKNIWNVNNVSGDVNRKKKKKETTIFRQSTTRRGAPVVVGRGWGGETREQTDRRGSDYSKSLCMSYWLSQWWLLEWLIWEVRAIERVTHRPKRPEEGGVEREGEWKRERDNKSVTRWSQIVEVSFGGRLYEIVHRMTPFNISVIFAAHVFFFPRSSLQLIWHALKIFSSCISARKHVKSSSGQMTFLMFSV